MLYNLSFAALNHLKEITEVEILPLSPLQQPTAEASLLGFSQTAGTNTQAAQKELESQGLVLANAPTADGFALARVVFAPQKVISTLAFHQANLGPTNYLFLENWAVVLLNQSTKDLSIFWPVNGENIANLAAKNLLPAVLPPYQPFELKLTSSELLVFELSQPPQNYPSQNQHYFNPQSILQPNNLARLAAVTQLDIGDKGWLKVFPELQNPKIIQACFDSLQEKGVFNLIDENMYIHSFLSETWLLDAGVLDVIIIEVLPKNEKHLYKLRAAGLVKQWGAYRNTIYQSVPNIDTAIFI